jgi:hypothetical protein
MDFKFIEIRDEGTCIAAVAFRMRADTEVDQAFFYRCGYPQDGSGIVLMELSRQKATSDPYEWQSLGFGPRTMPVVHDWLYKPDMFDSFVSGQVIDVRVILGEAAKPADGEILR